MSEDKPEKRGFSSGFLNESVRTERGEGKVRGRARSLPAGGGGRRNSRIGGHRSGVDDRKTGREGED